MHHVMVDFLTMATNHLKFINEVETKAKSLSGDSVRRNLDALDELRTENARLRRELIETREENRQLREQVDRAPVIKTTAPVISNAAMPKSVAIEQPVKDDTEIRFSLLELDIKDS